MRQKILFELGATLIPIARGAGRVIMEIYSSSDVGATLKADASPVTVADLLAHKHLVHSLQNIQPEFPVVSEEGGESEASRGNGCFWLIDPLDGTREFLARNDEFTVNIALIEHGRCVLGVVYAPAIDTLYWGGKGMGAYRIIGAKSDQIHVGNVPERSVIRVVASKSHLNAETSAFIERLGMVSLIQAGSSLKFCRVAEGAADIYPRLAPTCEWDTAAAQAVLEGAGGYVVDLAGQSLRYGKSEILNPYFVATRDIGLIPS